MHTKRIIFGLIASLLCGGAIFWSVNAQSAQLSEQQLSQIKGECTATKSTLNQLHSSDALLRVNTGQLYETIATKLMARFNERANYNNMDDDLLVASANNFNSLLSNFRSDYIIYEQHLTAAIDTDCAAQPATFYDAVALARTSREKMHNDVVLLNQALDQYDQTLTQFETDNNKRIKELDK